MNQVAKIEPKPTETGTLMQVIATAARDPSVDIEKMRSLLQMHQELRAREAEVAYNAAMKDVQAEVGPVGRDKTNDHTRSRYARLETIIAALNPISTKHGFSMTFGTDDSPLAGHYRVTCDVLHEAGHKRHYFADVPTDLAGSQGKANKTGIQAFGSAMTYARRYLTIMIFNIAIADEDDDGNAAGGNGYPQQKRTREQISAEANRKRQDLRDCENDINQMETLYALEKYEKDVLTPEFMASLGMKQYALANTLEKRRDELTRYEERDQHDAETGEIFSDAKADYIQNAHNLIAEAKSDKALLEWWNNGKAERIRRGFTVGENDDLMERVKQRCSELSMLRDVKLMSPLEAG